MSFPMATLRLPCCGVRLGVRMGRCASGRSPMFRNGRWIRLRRCVRCCGQRGDVEVVPVGEARMEVARSVPCGHVATVLAAMRRLNMAEVVGLEGPVGKRVQAMIAARILDPQSKLATAQGLGGESGWLQALIRMSVGNPRWIRTRCMRPWMPWLRVSRGSSGRSCIGIFRTAAWLCMI